MHRKELVHCDLKPSNIMYFAADNRWKLIDLESARKAGYCGNPRTTPVYAAPEAICDLYPVGGWLTSHDLFSFGVIAFELLNKNKEPSMNLCSLHKRMFLQKIDITIQIVQGKN